MTYLKKNYIKKTIILKAAILTNMTNTPIKQKKPMKILKKTTNI